MSCKWLLAVFLGLISLKGSSQQTFLKGDYAEAVNLNINQKYIFKNAAIGFGREQEYPKKKKNNTSYLFEKERNTSWFSLTVPADGFLTFEIAPLSVQDDYDWMLFKEKPINSTSNSIDYNHPVRTNNSRNDFSVSGKTGLKDSFTENFTSPGPGKSFSKPIEVRKGENYILVVDNIYPGGKGFAFTAKLQNILPSQIPPLVISGIISDKRSMQPLRAEITAEDTAGKVAATAVSDSLTGKFSFKIPPGNNYTVAIEKPGYVLLNDFLPVKTASLPQNYQMQKVQTDAHIIFYNIRFLPNSAVIVNTSGSDLNRLLHFLEKEKNWKIQIIGHTNANVFTDERYLQRLSERRAWAIKNFLLNRGIASERMRCFGLGGKHPLYDNKKPEEAVKNLRVEIVLER
jgi:outer membrane protein OmpA-like peptidoglycan-associated protein